MTVRARGLLRIATAVLCALALAAAGCSRKDRGSTPPGSTPATSAGPSLDPNSAAAAEAALSAYRGYLGASTAANQAGDWQYPQLREYIVEPLLTNVQFGVRTNAEHGAMYQGQIGSKPRVTGVKLDGQPPTVTIEDCLDYSGYVLVYRSNQSPVAQASRGGNRVFGTAKAVRVDDGRWCISEATTDRSRAC